MKQSTVETLQASIITGAFFGLLVCFCKAMIFKQGPQHTLIALSVFICSLFLLIIKGKEVESEESMKERGEEYMSDYWIDQEYIEENN